jgi:hypothetical protein
MASYKGSRAFARGLVSSFKTNLIDLLKYQKSTKVVMTNDPINQLPKSGDKGGIKRFLMRFV